VTMRVYRADAYATQSVHPTGKLRWHLEQVPDQVPGTADRYVPCQ
jgi:hypothetical protein